MNFVQGNPLLSIDPTISNMEKFNKIIEAVIDLQAKYAQLQAKYAQLQAQNAQLEAQNAQLMVQINFLSGMMFHKHNQMPMFPCSRPKAPYHGAEDNGAEDNGFDDNEADDNEADDNEADDNEADDNEAEDNEAEDNEAEDNGSEDNGSEDYGSDNREADNREADNREADNRGAEDNGSEDNGSEGNGAEDYGSEGNEADNRGAEVRGADNRGAEVREADKRGAEDRGAEVRGADNRGAKVRGNLAMVNKLKRQFEEDQLKEGCKDLSEEEQNYGKGRKPDYLWHPNNCKKTGGYNDIFYNDEAGQTGFRWIYHILEEDPDYDFQGNLNTQQDVYQSYHNWATNVNKENNFHIHQITAALSAANVLKLNKYGDVTWFKKN